MLASGVRSASAEHVEDLHEERDAPRVARGEQRAHQRRDTRGRCGGKAQATIRLPHQPLQAAELGERGDAALDEASRELQHETALDHGLPGGDFADPVMRQVGANQDKVARMEGADMVADIALALRRSDEVQLVFGMEMPAHRAVRVAMRPDLEGLVVANLHELQVGVQCRLPPPPQGHGAHGLGAQCAHRARIVRKRGPPPLHRCVACRGEITPRRLQRSNDTFLPLAAIRA